MREVTARRRDLLLAAAVAVVQVAGTVTASFGQPQARAMDAVSVLLLFAGPAALVLLRNRPQVPLAVSLLALVAYLARDYALGPVFLAFVISLVTCVLSGRRVAALLGAGAFETSALVALAVGEIGLQEVTGATAWTVTVVAVSEVVRARPRSCLPAATSWSSPPSTLTTCPS